MIPFNLFSLTLLVLLTKSVFVKSKFELNLVKSEMQCNSEILNCSMVREGNTLSGVMFYLQDVPRFTFNVQFLARSKNARSFQTLSNVHQDYCLFEKHPHKDPFASLYWNLMNKNPENHLFGSCPVLKVTYIF